MRRTHPKAKKLNDAPAENSGAGDWCALIRALAIEDQGTDRGATLAMAVRFACLGGWPVHGWTP